jgi:serine/threonine-protein kinase
VPGYRLDGRYELLYPYAQGGMATVWVARVTGKHGFEKLVAVKTILPHLASDQGFRDMFLDEASIASRIRHPNVADIVDLGEENGTLYMVLEWINGDSWSKLFAGVQAAGHPFPIHILLRIAADACAGLHAAHELRDDAGAVLGVVHRDVTPQNILITIGGVTKVIDFGIAKAMDRTAEATQTGMLKGKAQYMAPEQARGKNVDRRADVWAMGTILYQYLSGHLPFEGKNDLATLRALTSGRPPEPLPPTVPPDVVRVVMTALMPQMEQRFQTALDMQRALESILPQSVTTTDVAGFMGRYLEERIETRRKDLAEAIAELDEAAGKPKPARTRKSSIQELARPAILDQVLGPAGAPARAGDSTAMAPLTQAAAGQILGAPSAPPAIPTAPPPPLGATRGNELEDVIPTRMREGGLRPVHYVMMGVGALVPIVVWSLVAWVAFIGPLGHRPPSAPNAAQSARP